MLTPREIIAQAWTIATTEPTLKLWGFPGSTLRLLLDIKLVSYQLYFLGAFIAGKEVGLFDDAEWLYAHVSLPIFTTITISFLVLLGTELLFPSFTDGAIIGLTAKAHRKEPRTGGFVMALYNFFAILTFHEIFIFSGVNLLITAISIILRYGGGMVPFLIVIAVIVWLISSLLKFLASFAESAIVVKKANVFNAISESIKLVFSYPWHVIFILLLMLIISIRIFINLAILIIVPGVAFGLGLVLTFFLTPVISYTIASIVALILIGVASYFFTYLHVFKQAVWTIMYMELMNEKELDKIG